MARLTQLEDDIKKKKRSYKFYQDKLETIRQKEIALLAVDGSLLEDAVDAAEDVIKILFSRYK